MGKQCKGRFKKSSMRDVFKWEKTSLCAAAVTVSQIILATIPPNLSSMHGLLRKHIRKDPFNNLLLLTVLEVFRSLWPCRQGLEPVFLHLAEATTVTAQFELVPLTNELSRTAQICFQCETKIMVQWRFLFWHWSSAQLLASLPLRSYGGVNIWSLQEDRVGHT